MNWHWGEHPHFSGNFWVASARWLRSLPDFATYHSALGLVRFSCEFWIGSAEGCRPLSLCCTGEPFWAADYPFERWLGEDAR